MNKPSDCMEEVAQVVALEGSWAWVEAEAKSACKACTSKANCGSHMVSSMFGPKKRLRLKIVNDFGARLSEWVVIGWTGKNFIGTVALTYLLPCLSCVLLAMLGGLHSEGASALGALAGLLGGLGGVAFYNRLRQSEAHQNVVFLRRTKGNLL